MKSVIAKQLAEDLISYSISFDTDETYGVISNMQLTGGTPAEVNDIKVVRFCDKYKGQAINIRLDTRPDLAALAAEYEQLVTARNAIRTAKHAAEKAAQDAIDNELLDVMNAKAATLIAQIPADHVRVTVKKIGDADGDPILEYAANGVKLGWHDVTIIGWASAIRPGALGSFAEICVASIDREKLEQIRTAQQASTIAKQAAKESREKELQETAIPQYAIDAYNHYHGDADAAWEDENEGDWAMIEKWAPYIEAQHGMNPKKMHKIISESSRETNYGIND
jgi:hypothetical protein